MWAVTSGEYSAYEIRAVFSTEHAARATADLMNGPGGCRAWRIEEWPLDVEPHRKAWVCTATVRVAREVTDGDDPPREWRLELLDTPDVEIREPKLNDDEAVSPSRVETREWWMRRTRDEPPYEWSVRVEATDPERAKKVAAERAYQVAAQWEIEVGTARGLGGLG